MYTKSQFKEDHFKLLSKCLKAALKNEQPLEDIKEFLQGWLIVAQGGHFDMSLEDLQFCGKLHLIVSSNDLKAASLLEELRWDRM